MLLNNTHLVKLLGLQLLHCLMNDDIVTCPEVIAEPQDDALGACTRRHAGSLAC